MNFIKLIFVFISIFSLLVLGSYRVGPLTIRNYITILLGIYVIFNAKKIYFDRNLNIYVVFIITIIIISFINGDGFTSSFWQVSIIGRHIPCLIAISSLIIYSHNNNLAYIYKSLFVIFILNGILTTLQFYNYPMAWTISQTLNPIDLEAFEMRLNDSLTMSGVALAGGLFGFAVSNGYFIASYAPIFSKNLWDRGLRNYISGIFVLVLSVFVAFETQQRMAILVLAVFFCFVFLKNNTGTLSKILTISVIGLFLYYLINSDVDLGRISTEHNNEDRRALAQSFVHFLSSEYVLFGGYSNYSQFGEGQHNSILDSITRFGLIGSVVFISLFYRITRWCYTILRIALKSKNTNQIVLSISCLLYLLYSMTHSIGVQSGDIMFWLMFTLLYVQTKNIKGATDKH